MTKKNNLSFYLIDLSSEIFEFKDELINIVQLRFESPIEDEIDFYPLIARYIECVIEEPEKSETIQLKETLYGLCVYSDDYFLINETVDHFYKVIINHRFKAIELSGCNVITDVKCYTRFPTFVIGIEYEYPRKPKRSRARLRR